MGVMHRFTIEENERQLLMLALATLALERPGFEDALGKLAEVFRDRDLFEKLMRLNADRSKILRPL